MKQFNWAGNYEYSTNNIYYPKNLEEVRELVSSLPKVKVLGTRHSFNGIADSKHNLLSLQEFEPFISIDRKSQTATVSASMRYGQLCQHLYREGFALHNLGSLPHISVAGACVGGTHGSGVKNGILATAVSAIEFVTASGEVVVLSKMKDGEKFYGAVVNLGGLGVITKLTLELQPTFNMRQDVYENLPLRELEKNADEILSVGYSVSLFTDWKTTNINQVWIKKRLKEANSPVEILKSFFGATPATKDLHPIISMPAENCTAQMGVDGPWYDRLPHFRMEFTPSNGEELQSEYFVPREHAYEAILAIDQLRDLISPYILISELRTVDADRFWMSPFYNQPSLAIHFTWIQDWPAIRKLLPLIEAKLAPFAARPHWGKLFTMEPSKVQSFYGKLKNFQQLLKSYDPEGKFRNDYLDEYIFS